MVFYDRVWFGIMETWKPIWMNQVNMSVPGLYITDWTPVKVVCKKKNYMMLYATEYTRNWRLCLKPVFVYG